MMGLAVWLGKRAAAAIWVVALAAAALAVGDARLDVRRQPF